MSRLSEHWLFGKVGKESRNPQLFEIVEALSGVKRGLSKTRFELYRLASKGGANVDELVEVRKIVELAEENYFRLADLLVKLREEMVRSLQVPS